MTTIVPTFSKIRGPAGGIDAVVATWTALAASGDVGQPLQRVDLSDRSVQVAGSFAGATIVFEGSCQSAPKFDPSSASNFDPFARRGLLVAPASELAGVVEAMRAPVA